VDPSDEVRPDTDINGDIGFREDGEPRRHPLAVIGRTKTVLSANAQSSLMLLALMIFAHLAISCSIMALNSAG
jgi:hypothetical protein